MTGKPSEVIFENKRLEDTKALAEEQIKQARQRNEKNRKAIIEAKKDLRENTSHSMMNLSTSEDFEALAELNQYAGAVTEKIVDYEEVEQNIQRLEKLIQSPYFARIDFKFEDENTVEKIYIGRSSLKDDKTYEMYVYDWRSPIASVFYRFITGAVFYDAPGGRIKGDVSLKRQYEIQNGKLEFFFDADVQIVDEFLRKLLSQNASPKMKAIVETIQREQDVVIRDMESDLMMVQGVAGSGKTSIALHRAAYLMYQGLSAKLKAENILILSPNPLFEQYISNVLPELGESNVTTVVFEDIMGCIMNRKDLQTKNRFLESMITDTERRAILKRSIEFKTSCRFMELLDRFLEEIPRRWIHFEDIYYEGQCIIRKERLKEKVLGRTEIPLGLKLKQLEEFIRESVRIQKNAKAMRAERGRISQISRQFTELDLRDLYSRIFEDREYFWRLAEGLGFDDSAEEILEHTREHLDSGKLPYDDAFAIFYLHLKIYGSGRYKSVIHVIIDEAQDYYPLQYEMIRLLFPNARFTVLGDINQTLLKREDLTLYDQVRIRLKKKKASLSVMDKSFRCTSEILNYSLRFISQRPEVKSFNRSGDLPQIRMAPDEASLCNLLEEEIAVCIQKGYQSVGLICKSEKNAAAIHRNLKKDIDIQLIQNNTAASLQGIFVIPSYMSKGLEFDAVLICDADAGNYYTEEDKNILYIACTRALHRLTLLGTGEASPLL